MKKLRKINHRIYNLSDFDDYSNTSNSFLKFLQDNINQFTTSSNPSITSYLQNKALLLNQQNSLRTYFIVDTDTLEIIGYFCLKIVNIKFETNVSRGIKKRISSDAYKNNEFPSLLITKLGRNDKYKNLVFGKTILDYAISIGLEVFKKTALRHICVDWYEQEKLKRFYCEECGFKIFQYKYTDKGKLVSGFYKLN